MTENILFSKGCNSQWMQFTAEVHQKMTISKTMKKISGSFTKYNTANIDLEMF